MTGIDFLVDTNILIYLHEAKPEVLAFIDYSWSCSVISEMELLGTPNLSKTEKQKLQSLLNDCIIFSLDNDIKEIAIKIRQTKKVKLPDAIIAATAIHYNLPLVTADTGFKNISGLTVITLS
jgi:predicted nucleic acid-binding protein